MTQRNDGGPACSQGADMSTQHTPGPWLIATSNSWRRIVSERGATVCEPITQPDGHPDLHFPNGGADGPDAHLAAAPDMYAALKELADAGAEAWGEDRPCVKAARAALTKAEGNHD